MRHVVQMSGGVGSWATAKRVAKRHGTNGLVMLFADTQMEDEDTYRFLEAGAANVGAELVKVADGRDIWEVFADVRFLGNTRIDPCSRILKRELLRKWINENCDPAETVVYLGISWDEEHRAKLYERFWNPYRVECPLIDRPHLSKDDMHAWAEREGLPKQRLYELGFPHANCGGGCVKAGQAQFELLLRKLPDRYRWWEENEERMMGILERKVTILRDRRIVHGKEITTPLSLREFRERLERQPALFDAEEFGGCGCMTPALGEL